MSRFRSHRQNIFAGTAHAALLLALALASLAAIPPAASAAQSPVPTLQVRAPRQVAVGQLIPVTLTVRDAGDVAGYETTLLYDTTAAEFAGLHQRQNDLKRLGRDVGPLAVAQMPNGSAIGLYSCATADCVRPAGARQSGGRGVVRLATIDLIATQPGPLEIRLDATKFVDAAGSPVDVALRNQSVVVQVGQPGGGPSRPAPAGRWALAAAGLATASAVAPGPFDLTGDGQVSHADAGEWLSYDVDVATAGAYHITVRAATINSGRRMHVEVDGANVTGSLAIPQTGGWQTWANVTSGPIQLGAGPHTLKLIADSSDFNINYVSVIADS